MDVRILPAAQERLLEVWHYTSRQWDDEQADKYVSGLISAVEELASERMTWRAVRQRGFGGVFFVRHRHHFIFFKILGDGSLGIISVLHEKMDLPRRLRDDTAGSG